MAANVCCTGFPSALRSSAGSGGRRHARRAVRLERLELRVLHSPPGPDTVVVPLQGHRAQREVPDQQPEEVLRARGVLLLHFVRRRSIRRVQGRVLRVREEQPRAALRALADLESTESVQKTQYRLIE